jgi:5-methyltetrahydrofolate--homocysteine methyltransferase
MFKEHGREIPILIGGAPVNDRHAAYVAMHGQDDAEQIFNNVFYCESGMEGVNIMNTLVDAKARTAFLMQNKIKLAGNYRKAKGIEDTKQKLLATLSHRKVNFKDHEPPREGFGVHRVEFKLHNLSQSIDTKSLYSLNWEFGKQSSWLQKGVTLERLKQLEHEWMEKAEANHWIIPSARFALLPAQSDGNEVIIYDPANKEKELGRILFNECIGKGQKDKFCVAQYFYPKSSGHMDVIGLQITTAGKGMLKALEEFKSRHDSESAMFLQGLSDRVAEDLAEYIHQLLRQRAGLKKEKNGQRYSPGYPALENLDNNEIIYNILQAGDMGIELTGACQFDPPSTTAAVVCFHRDAGYT